MLAFSPPFDEDEVTQASSPPSHEDENMVSCTLFQAFDSYDASFHDLESQEVLEEPLDVVSFSSNKEHDDCIDDFIHVGRRRWDVSCFYFDGDPLYEDDNGPRIKNAKLFPLEHTFITIVD
jgi:hypothetical protein